MITGRGYNSECQTVGEEKWRSSSCFVLTGPGNSCLNLTVGSLIALWFSPRANPPTPWDVCTGDFAYVASTELLEKQCPFGFVGPFPSFFLS